jgi:hypothetical protein
MDRWSRSTSHGSVFLDPTCLRLAWSPCRDLRIRRQARSIDRHFETEGSGAPGSRQVPSVCSLRDAGDCPWGAAERARVEANLRLGSGCGFCRNVVESRSLSGKPAVRAVLSDKQGGRNNRECPVARRH